MTLLLVFYGLDMSWLPLFWLDISRIVFGYQGGADSLIWNSIYSIYDLYAQIYNFSLTVYSIWNVTRATGYDTSVILAIY